MCAPPEPAAFSIVAAHTSEYIPTIHALFSAYVDWLPVDIAYQSFESELASLPGLYDPSVGGCILLAVSPNNTPLGCIALRSLKMLGKGFCEVKRLYVVPEARGMGVARKLVEEVLKVAREPEKEYREVKLDTLASMTGARKVYERAGFQECGKYYETPIEEICLFYGLKL